MRTIMMAVAVLLSGCLAEGVECTGGASCADGVTSFWCEASAGTNRLAKYACPGPLGCASNNGQTICDFRGSTEGSPCPTAAKGNGFCSSGTRFVTCNGAAWSGRDCSSCNTNGLVATCQP